MSAVYDDGRVVLHQGHALDVLREMPDGGGGMADQEGGAMSDLETALAERRGTGTSRVPLELRFWATDCLSVSVLAGPSNALYR